MTVLIETPLGCEAERDYVIGVLLGDFLGLKWDFQPSNREDVRITVSGEKPGAIILPDVLFSSPEAKWLTTASLPIQPLQYWNTEDLGFPVVISDSVLPIIYGDNISAKNEEQELKIRLPVDVFGSAFFMLTRYEEIVKNERDEHDRFPAWASLAFQEGFLDRPVVDEYTEVLWSAFSRLWPDLERKERNFRTQISHDVDHTSRYAFCDSRGMIRRVAGDILLRNDYGALVNGPWTWLTTREKLKKSDPYNNFDWIMDLSQEFNLKNAFYFMTGVTNPRRDGHYDIDHPTTRELLRRVYSRGHEIGLHPSYETYLDGDQMCREADKLRAVLREEGIPSEDIGGRMHYLRWRTPDTMLACIQAGMAYDCTLGFADHAGFRSGTSHQYPAFDVMSKRPLPLKLKPLIVMECSVFSDKYMGIEADRALASIEQLKLRTIAFGGCFTILWHNSELVTNEQRNLYNSLCFHRQ